MFWFRENFVHIGRFGESRGGRPLYFVRIGQGENRVMLTACHHANEFLTGLCLWGALEDYCRRLQQGELSACTAFTESTLLVVPWVNPDGAALLLGLAPMTDWERAEHIAKRYPQIPFPEGWKANLRGVDLNLNYPASWEEVKRCKAQKGIIAPAPRDYAGDVPLSEPETCALVELTRDFSPDTLVALHSQGEEIYVNYKDQFPKGSKALALKLSEALGYAVVKTPPDADGGGYKDWFMDRFARPAATVEMGLGENPLPLSQFPGLLEKTCRLIKELL